MIREIKAGEILKEEIKTGLFRFLNMEISGEEFEEWTYLFCDYLEKELPLDDYLDIMCFNYRKKAGYYTFAKLLFRNINRMEFENYRLRKLFAKAMNDDEILESALVEAYELAANGNEVFRELGYEYGATLYYGDNIGDEYWCIAETEKEFIEKYRKKIYTHVEKIIKLLNEQTLELDIRRLDRYWDSYP